FGGAARCARRRGEREGPVLLRGQARRDPVLRRADPAAPVLGTGDRREHRQRADGARRGPLPVPLSPSDGRLPPGEAAVAVSLPGRRAWVLRQGRPTRGARMTEPEGTGYQDSPDT